MSDDDREPSPRPENLMQRRLRKAGGEAVDDPLDDLLVYDEAPPVVPGVYRPRAVSGSGGCAQATLYLVLGALAALLMGAFVLNQWIGGVARAFQPPDLGTMIATPTPTVLTSAAVVQRIQALSRLETAAYTVQTVIDVTQSQGNPLFDFFAGDALLLIARGTVVAGVDLGTLAADDVAVSPDGRRITVSLPPATIFSASLDNSGTRVYSRNRGWFAPDNRDLETLARQQAEAEILQAACEDGVLSKATAQAETTLRQLLGLLDGTEILIVTAPPQQCGATGL
ncbi:MAG: DUF4230 domain-containing protein [Chloroflexi bacterium]|nr:DUF4230 domain-containing protein [Chloroflexota bacterium]